jgi:hypothetical protein
VSTANLATFVSTSYLATQLGSTVRGLGTAGYLSTSTPFTGSTNQLSAAIILVSSINAAAITTSNLTVTGGTQSINFNGSQSVSAYGVGVDLLSLKTSLAQYNSATASLYFGTSTLGYPLARIAASDTSIAGPASSALIFQTATAIANANTSGVNVFRSTGANQSWTAPSGVTSVSVFIWGAGGGSAQPGNAGFYGGAGAFISGTLAVTPGTTYNIIVGGAGQPALFNGAAQPATFGGGGAGAGPASGNQNAGGSGGGRSSIQITLSVTATGVVSGGNIVYTTSAAHGLSMGQVVILTNLSPNTFNITAAISALTSNTFTVPNNTSATGSSTGTGTIVAEIVSAGGGGGAGNSTGGTGAMGVFTSGTARGVNLTGGNGTNTTGGGGGGGYYGGAGAGFNGGGGGGTSYTGASVFTLVSGINSPNSAFQAPATTNTYYVAYGASSNVAAAVQFLAGGPGLVVIVSEPSSLLSEAMRIDSNANVGIGTANPQALLHVSGMTYSVSMSTQALTISSINGQTLGGMLASTVRGLGTVGYLSSATVLPGGLVSTANLATLVSTTYLATQLGSTVIGLGTAGYISSSQLLSTSLGLSEYISSFIDPTELTSTVVGLGTQGFVSSLGLTYAVASTAQGLGTFGYTSTSQLLSTSLGLYQAIQNSPTALVQANLTSTVIGLGTAGYISSAQLLSTTYGDSQNFITQNQSVSSLRFSTATGNNAYISSLTIDQLIFGDGNGWADFAVLRAVAISTLQINTGIIYANTVSTSQIIGVNFLSQANLTSTVIGLGTVGYISSQTAANLANLVSTANLATLVSTTYLDTQLGSTVIGLGTAGYISSSQLLSTSLGLSEYISSFIDPTELTSTVVGLGTQGFVSSLGLTYAVASTAQGLGTFGYTSTSQLLSTSLGLYQQIQTSPTNITQANLTSTITGLGTFGYLSTVTLGSLVSTANLANLVSTANLATLVSTTYLATQLGSTVRGLGTAGYLSSINYSTVVLSSLTAQNINSVQGYISSLVVDSLQLGSNTAYIYMGDVIATSLSTVYVAAGSATILSISAQQLFVSSIQATNIIGALTTTNLTSTVIGLGTTGYISSSQLLSTSLGLSQYISSFIDPTELTSTVVGLGTQGFVSSLGLTYAVASTAQGLGTFGYTSTSQLLSTSLGLYQQIQTSPTNITQADVTSTIVGLGTFGYISTVALGSLISTANLVNLVSTANLANLVSTTYMATQLGSTVRGLGTAGYLSSINYSTVSISSLSTQYITSVQGYISSLTVDSFFLGSNSAFFNMGDVIATSLSTIQINVGAQFAITISAQQLFVSSIQATNIIGALQTANLTSTVIGLGTAGYISSSQLLSTSLGLSQYISSFIDPTELTSTVVGLGTQGFVSSLGLTYAVASTAQGLGTFGYTSTSQLLSTSLGLYQQIQTSPTNITQTNLTSTIIGLGTVGYLSTVALGSLVSTANLANHISTANLANFVSTTYLSTQLGSTFATLNVSSLSTFSFTGTTAFISSLTVNGLFIGSNQGFVNMGDVIATSLSSLVVYTGSAFATSNQATIVSAQQLNVSSITGITFLSQTALTSTVIGLGTTGYISSSQLLSTSLGLSQYISSFIDPTELTSTVVGLGTQGFVSSLGLTYAVASTAQGLGTFGYTSTSQLLSTSLGLYQQIQTSPTNITQTNLTSTITGLGTFGYLSTVALGALVSTANLANHISTANLANFVSTTYLSTQLGSTFATLNVSSLSTFNFIGTTGFISTLTVNNLFIGSNQGFTTMGDVIGTSISTILLFTGVEYATNIFASSLNVSSIASYSNQATILSTQQLNVSSITGITFLSQTALTSTVIGLGTVGYLSSATASALPGGLVSTANLTNLISTANLATLVSTTYLATQLGSTVIGLGTAGYISSSQLLSTSLGLSEYISSFIDPTELTSTVVGLGTQGFVSSLGLTYAVASTAQGLGTFGYTSTSQLLSTSLGLYQEMQTSVTFFVEYSITSTITGLGTFGYLSTVILDSLVSTANLTNLVSTANLTNLVSTANLATLVSTSFFDYALTSTVIGLGTVGYLSSAIAATLPEGLISTANLADLVSTANLEGFDFYLGTQIGSTVIGLGTAGYLSSATAGVLPGDLVSTSHLSTQLGSTFSVLNVSSLSTFSLIGTTAFISSLTVYNLNIGFDPGYVNMGDIIATSLSSVLVNTNYIFATSNQSQNASTQQLNVSSINGQTFGGPIVSTVIGLGTAGYISTATLLSTSAGLGSQIAAGGGGGLTTNNLTSTVIGLGTAGYVSTATLLSTSAGLTTQIAAGGSLTGPKVSTQQLLASSIGILTVAPSFPLDVFGSSRTGMPVSSLCNTGATIGLTGFGIFYYITNSGFNTVALPATDPSFSGWFVTLRNNTGSYLSVTITGTDSKIPASPFSLPPANSVSLVYDTAPPAGGCNWVYF